MVNQKQNLRGDRRRTSDIWSSVREDDITSACVRVGAQARQAPITPYSLTMHMPGLVLINLVNTSLRLGLEISELFVLHQHTKATHFHSQRRKRRTWNRTQEKTRAEAGAEIDDSI